MTSRKRLAVAFGVVALTLFGALSSAHAQYAPPPPYYPPPPPPPRGVYRSGLLVGFSLGGGSIVAQDCGDACGSAFMGEFHIGAMLNPRLALMGDFWAGGRTWGSDVSTVHSISTAAVQYWASDIIWLKGGIGVGRMQLSDTFGTFGDETGLGIMGAGGIELVQSFNFVLDLQLRLGHGFYSAGGDVTNFAFMVGFNWY